jgi:hypothetical protein
MDYAPIPHQRDRQYQKRDYSQPECLGHARTVLVRIASHEGILLHRQVLGDLQRERSHAEFTSGAKARVLCGS